MKAKIVVALSALLVLPEFAFAQVLAPAFGSNSSSASSWLAGAQAGYNWQSGSVVYGVEADIAGTGLKNTMNTTLQSIFIPLRRPAPVPALTGTARFAAGSAGRPVRSCSTAPAVSPMAGPM